jgi:hypothetical protein
MDMTTTLILMAAMAGVFGIGSWIAARPADPLNPRLIPWRPIILVAGVVGLILAAHLVNLLGFSTGIR